MAIAGEKTEGGTMIVPGHGRISDEADLVEYRDMTTIIRDRMQDMVNRGMTLAQVQAARPTMEYDGIYGSAHRDGRPRSSSRRCIAAFAPNARQRNGQRLSSSNFQLPQIQLPTPKHGLGLNGKLGIGGRELTA